MKRAIDFAMDDLGTWEISGVKHNPKIVQYFADVGHSWVKDDETAWCAAAMGAWLKKAGLPHTGKLNARSYLDWGEPISVADAREGDVVIFSRGNSSWQGHVAFLCGINGDKISVIGGNQSNHVNIQDYHADRLLGIRRWPDPVIDDKRSRGFLSALLSLFGRK